MCRGFVTISANKRSREAPPARSRAKPSRMYPGSEYATRAPGGRSRARRLRYRRYPRSEEHTSELQSRVDLVCRLLLEKKTVTGEELEKLSDEELLRQDERIRVYAR